MGNKRRIIYAGFYLDNSYLESVVRKDTDGMWYLRKTDIFDRRIRFNPKEQRLEVEVYPMVWDIYQSYIYQVEGWNSNGNSVHIE